MGETKDVINEERVKISSETSTVSTYKRVHRGNLEDLEEFLGTYV